MIVDDTSLSFWRWLIKGSGGKSGYRRLVNSWLFVHFAIGVSLAYLVRIDLASAANTVLLPLAAVLIGLSFAWAGNAQALLQASDVQEMTELHSGGFTEYVFTYQVAIFAILLTLVCWALAGFQIFDKTWPTESRSCWYFTVKVLLFSFSSLTLRECWHVVLGAQWMLLIQHAVKRSKHDTNKK
ncbi:MAG: hypothetical protein ABI728_03095 [Betaproteobacteria bacterium]